MRLFDGQCNRSQRAYNVELNISSLVAWASFDAYVTIIRLINDLVSLIVLSLWAS